MSKNIDIHALDRYYKYLKSKPKVKVVKHKPVDKLKNVKTNGLEYDIVVPDLDKEDESLV